MKEISIDKPFCTRVLYDITSYMPEYQRIRMTHFFAIVHQVLKPGFYGLGPKLAVCSDSRSILIKN